MTVRITNIQYFSLHDGKGIRTTVFLKGCNLNCPWCCNPENINYSVENYTKKGILKSFGYDISLENLEEKILKDKNYYETGGGVTFSGGEPFLQIKKLLPLLISLKEKGINICFESSLSFPSNLLELGIDYIDELFIDIKILDKEESKKILNLDLDVYFENLNLIQQSNIKRENITFRIPLNNEFTLKDKNIKNIINLLSQFSDFNVEIFKTHNLAENKYKLLNKEMFYFSDIPHKTINDIYKKIYEVNKNVKIIKSEL